MHTSAYIHKNPLSELRDWKGKEVEYPWSSFSGLCFVKLLGKSAFNWILFRDRYKNEKGSYFDFAKTSSAKEGIIKIEPIVQLCKVELCTV